MRKQLSKEDEEWNIKDHIKLAKALTFKGLVIEMNVDIKELRLGNILQTQYGDAIKVSEINGNGVVFYVVNRKKFPLKYEWWAGYIPITKKSLQRYIKGVGIVKSDNLLWLGDGFKLYIRFEGENLKGVYMNDTQIPINTIHSFQNLYFLLFNQELEINEKLK